VCGGAEEGKVMVWWCFERRKKNQLRKMDKGLVQELIQNLI
jgi:hypothetical protein